MISFLLTLLLTSYAKPDALVETAWLADHLNDEKVRIVDMRVQGFADGHIPGALHLENRETRNPKNLPTFVPLQRDFEQTMARLGISNNTRVVVYDDRGGIYAARLWWLLNYYGHPNVALLNGGWIKWMKEGRPASTETRQVTPTTFRAKPDAQWLATAQDVRDRIDTPKTRLIDARTEAEIEGRDLRGIKRGGFIPSSIPVYWEDALDPEWKTFKPATDLERLYQGRDIRPDHEVIAYCQVGMRASHDLFVLHLLGYTKLRNYLGSWEEWGNRDDLPIATKK